MHTQAQLRGFLIARRDILLGRYRDVLERADAALDAQELEDGEVAAELWQERVLALYGDDLAELREVIDAIEQCDRRDEGACEVCGSVIDRTWMPIGATRCSDCAITRVMTVIESPDPADTRALRRAD